MTETKPSRYRHPRYATIEEAIKAMIQGKREDPFEIAFLNPADDELAMEWNENDWRIMTGYTSFTNLQVLAYELPVSNTMGMSEDEALGSIQDESSYVRDLAEKISTETGIDANAGWRIDYIEGVDQQAEEDRELPLLIFFSEEGWGKGKKAMEEFSLKWENAGLRSHLEFDESKKCIEGSFLLHPKGGFFLKQNKLNKDNKERLAELKTFLLSLKPLFRIL